MNSTIKHLIIAVVVVLNSNGIFAQTDNNSANMNRKEKRSVEREHFYQLTKERLHNRSFVLETDFLQNRNGIRVPVNSTINFIMVDTNESIIQIGSTSGIGYNGVGGITVSGRITKWKLKENEEKKTFDLVMHTFTSVGSYDVNMSVGPGVATARLTGLQAGNLTFNGSVVALESSVVYEGNSL